MKHCPACNRTYTDDALLFCLEDGTQLQPAAAAESGPASYDPNRTLAFGAPRETIPPPANVVPVPQPAGSPQPSPSWGQSPAHTPAPAVGKASGRGWIVAAIAGVVALAIGIVVLLAIIGREGPSANKGKAANTSPSPTADNANKGATANASNFLTDDFSVENWPTGAAGYGSFYEDGEYHMKGQPNLYLYMFPVNYADYASGGATVKVTARSVDGKSPAHGYGLIMHGRTTQDNKLEGYGFLVNTAAAPTYQVVRFVDGDGKEIVKWTGSNVIRTGTSPNQLEVRAQGSQLSFYVNGQLLTSVTDTAGMTSGHVGLYTSETNEVAFDDMEITRQ